MKIEEAIQQSSFNNAQHKAGINLIYTASWFSAAITRMLKPFGISMQQFNILRILQGQKGQPAPLRLVTERMLDQMSNTSRLIDKLVAKGLVDRRQCPMDRRQVDLLLTDSGIGLVEQATELVNRGTATLFAHVADSDFQLLNRILDTLRSPNTELNH